MQVLRIATTALLLFIILIIALIVRDTESRETLVGYGVIVTAQVLALICIWG